MRPIGPTPGRSAPPGDSGRASGRLDLRAIGYIRVSTDEQAHEGVSLGAQEARIRARCAADGLDLVALYSDAGVSAKSLDRPGLRFALGRLDRGEAETLVITKLDRLTRSLRDWTALIEGYFGAGGGASRALISLGDSIDTGTAGGRMVLNILMTLAQWEREAIAERTRDALNHKRSKGERVGSVPVGCKLGADGVSLEADAGELRAMARIAELAAEGLQSRAIARALAAEEILGRSGRPWNESTIRQVLKRRLAS
ncbi:MAG: putative recombinase [Planctomycetota bacterium]|nr:putative recombinase [Planctomycetota bacterium]